MISKTVWSAGIPFSRPIPKIQHRTLGLKVKVGFILPHKVLIVEDLAFFLPFYIVYYFPCFHIILIIVIIVLVL